MEKKAKKNKEVLIVDKCSERREKLKNCLLQKNIACCEAETSAQAKAILDQFVPDLILIDTDLPDQDGVDLCRWATSKEWLSSAPVLMMSSRHDLSRRIQGFLAGAGRYLCHPFTADDFLGEIDILINKNIPVPREQELEKRMFCDTAGSEHWQSWNRE